MEKLKSNGRSALIQKIAIKKINNRIGVFIANNWGYHERILKFLLEMPILDKKRRTIVKDMIQSNELRNKNKDRK